jgi:hypothetical protein
MHSDLKSILMCLHSVLNSHVLVNEILRNEQKKQQ